MNLAFDNVNVMESDEPAGTYGFDKGEFEDLSLECMKLCAAQDLVLSLGDITDQVTSLSDGMPDDLYAVLRGGGVLHALDLDVTELDFADKHTRHDAIEMSLTKDAKKLLMKFFQMVMNFGRRVVDFFKRLFSRDKAKDTVEKAEKAAEQLQITAVEDNDLVLPNMRAFTFRANTYMSILDIANNTLEELAVGKFTKNTEALATYIKGVTNELSNESNLTFSSVKGTTSFQISPSTYNLSLKNDYKGDIPRVTELIKVVAKDCAKVTSAFQIIPPSLSTKLKAVESLYRTKINNKGATRGEQRRYHEAIAAAQFVLKVTMELGRVAVNDLRLLSDGFDVIINELDRLKETAK